MSSSLFATSDNPLGEHVQAGIRQSDPRLKGISVNVTGPDIVYLSGCVQSFYLRQLAVSVARQTEGVRYVSDGIHVATPADERKPR
jgi:osmotically-inducible protein OsmY